MNKIIRRCSICGKELEITVHEDGSYEGGHYFTKIASLGKPPFDEYWECDECFNEG